MQRVSCVVLVCFFVFILLTHLVSAPPPPPVPPLRDMNVVLLARRRQPTIDAPLPRTLPLLRAEWVSQDLGDFIPSNLWQPNIRQAYDKRAYLMAAIKKRREADGGSLVEASLALERDRNRLAMTVYKYWDFLKKRDRSVVRRVLRVRADRDVTPERNVRQRTAYQPLPRPPRGPAPNRRGGQGPHRRPGGQGRRPAGQAAYRPRPTLPHGMPANMQPMAAVNWNQGTRGGSRRFDDTGIGD
jgi:hypothetical protein